MICQRIAALICTCVLTVSASAYGLDVRLHASRTRGVAPLAVYFSTAGTTSAKFPRVFHHLTYQWDFRDVSSRQPRATGPIAAHVFERPGTFDVELTVRQPDGAMRRVTTRVEVLDPDVAFSGQRTVCVSVRGDFTGAPTGARHLKTDSFDTAMKEFRAGRRLLFRRGETFVSAKSHLLRTQSLAVLGAFGRVASMDARRIAANSPRIRIAKPVLKVEGSDLTVMDLQFESAGAGEVIQATDTTRRFLFLRLATSGFDSPFVLSHDVVEYWKSAAHDQMFFVDCRIENFRSVGIYNGGERLVFLGNRIAGSRTTHTLRIVFCRGCVLQGNDLADPFRTRHILKLHAQQSARYGRYSEDIVISENRFSCDASWAVTVGPQNSFSDEAVRNVLIERNLVRARGVTSVGFYINSSDTTLRNNVVVAENARDLSAILVTRRGIEPTPERVEVYHNTLYAPGAGLEAAVVRIHAHAGGPALVSNNLLFAPQYRQADVVTGKASFVARHNLRTTIPQFVDPSRFDFSLRHGSPAESAGTPVGVLDDRAGRARGPNAIPSIGASEAALAPIYGHGCGGLAIGMRGVPRLGTSFAIVVAAPFRMQQVSIAVGTTRSRWLGLSLPFALAPVGGPGCSLLVAPDHVANAPTYGDSAAKVWSIPNLAALHGVQVYCQAFASAPGANALGWVTSSGLAIQFAR